MVTTWRHFAVLSLFCVLLVPLVVGGCQQALEPTTTTQGPGTTTTTTNSGSTTTTTSGGTTTTDTTTSTTSTTQTTITPNILRVYDFFTGVQLNATGEVAASAEVFATSETVVYASARVYNTYSTTKEVSFYWYKGATYLQASSLIGTYPLAVTIVNHSLSPVGAFPVGTYTIYLSCEGTWLGTKEFSVQ